MKIDAFAERLHRDPRQMTAPSLMAAPWQALHDAGHVLYYPGGFSQANLTLTHHLIGIEFLPNIVSLSLGGMPFDTVVPAGSFYFVPAGSSVNLVKAHASEYLLLTIDPGLVGNIRHGMREQMFDAGFMTAARDVRRALLQGSVPDQTVAALAGAGIRALSTCRERELRAGLDLRLARSLELVRDNFQEKLSVDDMARAAGHLSPVRFAHLFSAAFALSAHQYLMQYRVHHALSRLRETRSPVADIACETGFCSQAHMTEVFRRRIGVSPALVRQTARGWRQNPAARPAPSEDWTFS